MKRIAWWVLLFVLAVELGCMVAGWGNYPIAIPAMPATKPGPPLDPLDPPLPQDLKPLLEQCVTGADTNIR
jgi:hypothetical protein